MRIALRWVFLKQVVSVASGTGSESCTLAGFGYSDAELSGSGIRLLVNPILCLSNVQ